MGASLGSQAVESVSGHLADRKTVLLVEDDPIYAEFVISSVREAALPFKVRHVKDLEEALAYVRGDPPFADRVGCPMPAIVLLDLALSGTSGFPVLRWLQENGKLQNQATRVVIMTGSDRTEDVQQALTLGALSYLVKSPFPGSIIGLLGKFA